PGRGPGGPFRSVGDVTAREGETADFTVTLSESSSQTVTVDYATQPGTAGSEDYQHTSGTLTFGPGQTTQHIVVPVAQDSDGPEHDQTFSVLLTNATNAPIRTVRGTATIPGD